MSARSSPYPPPGSNVRIPVAIWHAALEEVRRYSVRGRSDGRSGSEGLVYLGGIPTSDEVIVTSVLRIRHSAQGERVAPTTEEMRWVMTTLRLRDEKLVAQLHTHRCGAQHSPGDDRMATSFHEGFLSIVAPNFAVDVERIDQCIVHEYAAGSFRALPQAETERRFLIFELVIDRTSGVAEKEPRWARFARSLKSIARKPLWRRMT